MTEMDAIELVKAQVRIAEALERIASALEQKLQADLLDEYTTEEYEDWLVDDEDDEGPDWPDPVYEGT